MPTLKPTVAWFLVMTLSMELPSELRSHFVCDTLHIPKRTHASDALTLTCIFYHLLNTVWSTMCLPQMYLHQMLATDCPQGNKQVDCTCVFNQASPSRLVCFPKLRSDIEEAELKADDFCSGEIPPDGNGTSSKSKYPSSTHMAACPPHWPIRTNGQHASCIKSKAPPTAVATHVKGPRIQANSSYCNMSSSSSFICHVYHS